MCALELRTFTPAREQFQRLFSAPVHSTSSNRIDPVPPPNCWITKGSAEIHRVISEACLQCGKHFFLLTYCLGVVLAVCIPPRHCFCSIYHHTQFPILLHGITPLCLHLDWNHPPNEILNCYNLDMFTWEIYQSKKLHHTYLEE